jgi:hypothetical protein
VTGIVAGAPFFCRDEDGDGLAPGDSPASGVAVGVEAGCWDPAGIRVGEAEGLGRFFPEGLGEESGAGTGEDFFFFLFLSFVFGKTEGLDSTFSAFKLSEDCFFFTEEGEDDFSEMVADGFGVGDFSTSSFFFGEVELL